MAIGYNHPEARKTSKELLQIWNTCWRCGNTYQLSVHHDDRNRRNNSDGNTFVICARCHGRIHAKDPLLGKDRFKVNLSLLTAEEWQSLAIRPPEPAEMLDPDQEPPVSLAGKRISKPKNDSDSNQLNLFSND